MQSFRAFRVHNEGGNIEGRLEQIDLDALTPGEVVIRAAFSNVNYKDALAATGAGKIMRRFPMVGGVDVSGHVESSTDPRFKEGEEVLVAGCGLSEQHDGGYAQFVRVPGDCVVPLPEGLSLYDAMALGTAGFTVGIAVVQMEKMGQRPEHGPILVTGATGGVGNFAIDMYAKLGYRVTAFTRKREAAGFLKELGASEILSPDNVDFGKHPLEKARWGGAVDNVGGEVLTWLTRTVKPRGNIAAIGLAGGAELKTTVMPFILRGVNLLGINSVLVEPDFRDMVWRRVATDLRPNHLERIVTREISLDDLPGVFEGYMKGDVTGRTVVTVSP